ncbi:MAG: zinc-dependent peptidase [Burkholderiales bacterium]
MGLIQRLQRWREQRLVARHASPDALWTRTLADYPFLQEAPAPERLRQLASLFLATKEFHAAGGLVLTDAMAVAVAAQACLPVLHLGLGLYEGARGIVMHPAEVRAARRDEEEGGLVHEWDEELAGEAMEGGPLMLAWSAVEVAREQPPDEPVFNVVIHEFVHLIDMANGAADGVPPLPNAKESAAWLEGLTRAWDRFADRVAHREISCIDPYGCEALDEFFAVAAEAFFVHPERLKKEDPRLFAQLAGFFRPNSA